MGCETMARDTPDHIEVIADLVPQILTQIQPQIVKSPVPMPQAIVPQAVREAG